jgi:hypothetical protein
VDNNFGSGGGFDFGGSAPKFDIDNAYNENRGSVSGG